MFANVSSSGPNPDSPPRTPLKRVADLPGPLAWPVVGNFAQFEIPRLHAQLEGWAEQYGPLYRLKFGFRDVLVVARPDLITRILRDRPQGWRRLRSMQTVIREMGAHGLFSAEGEDWMRQRRLVMAAFDPGHLKNFFPSLLRATERLKGVLREAVLAHRWIDVQPVLMRYTVDVITGLAFGVDMNTQEDPDHELQAHLHEIFPMLMRRVNAPFPLWRYLKLPSDRKFDQHLTAVHVAVRSFIQSARERMSHNPHLQVNPTNLLEGMLAACDDQGGHLTEEELIGNVLTLLLAGEDTTANTLSWTLYLLHANPEAWQEVVREVDAFLGTDDMPRTFAVTRDLDAIERCLSESMRLRPVAPLIFLENNQETVIEGVKLPESSFVICVMRSGSLGVRATADACDFRPSRWCQDSPEEGDHRTENANHSLLKASMPFGAGPRMCPGRYLSLLEMKMVLSMLARNFELVDVSSPAGSPPQERMEFTMHPVGLRLKLGMREVKA